MAGPLFFDRVMETSTTTGTGTYTLAGAVTGYQTFAGVGDGNTAYYCAMDVDGNGIPTGGWEVGLGTYTAAGTLLARTTMLASSNSNNAVNWAAGTRRVFLVVPASIASSGVAQVVNTQTGAVATGSTLIPTDDTIPQNTEGTEFMTLAITPKRAENLLRIDVVCNLTSETAQRYLTAALFQDSTANALASNTSYMEGAFSGNPIVITFWMTAGTTSATTFKVRGGANGVSTVSFNGSGGVRIQGGVMYSSITITEYRT
jgi:hypothetical protein